VESYLRPWTPAARVRALALVPRLAQRKNKSRRGAGHPVLRDLKMAPAAGRAGARGRGAAAGRGGGPLRRPAAAAEPAVALLRRPAAAGRGAGGDSARPPSVLGMRKPEVLATARDGTPKVMKRPAGRISFPGLASDSAETLLFWARQGGSAALPQNLDS